MQNILDRFKLTGKIALITGGASGIGRELAIALGQAGATIVINDRSEESLINAKPVFAEHGIDIYTIAFDVTDEEAVVHGVKSVQQDVGPIDILINNAGIIKRIPMLEMTTDDFKEVIDVNLVSPLVVSRQVVPSMIKNGGGKIINICSLMSVYGRNSVSAYAAAKGGLMMLTRNMCVEWGKHNIQVNGIGPGYIKTAKTTEFASEGHPFNKLIMMRTPAARWGEVGDLCGAAILLASAAGNFINGQLLFVDGGITANFGYMEGEND
jgi:gluconate 5-dehydrogenase